jgi:hypothetical protein
MVYFYLFKKSCIFEICPLFWPPLLPQLCVLPLGTQSTWMDGPRIIPYQIIILSFHTFKIQAIESFVVIMKPITIKTHHRISFNSQSRAPRLSISPQEGSEHPNTRVKLMSLVLFRLEQSPTVEVLENNSTHIFSKQKKQERKQQRTSYMSVGLDPQPLSDAPITLHYTTTN